MTFCLQKRVSSNRNTGEQKKLPPYQGESISSYEYLAVSFTSLCLNRRVYARSFVQRKMRGLLWIAGNFSEISASYECGSVFGWGTMLQAGMSRVRFRIRSLDFYNLPNPSILLWLWGTEMSTMNLPVGKDDQRVSLITLPPSVNRLSGRYGKLEVPQPYRS
jgi:hypothetical protein